MAAYPVLLDEDMPTVIALVLRNQGYDVVAAVEAGLLRAPDSEVLNRATAEGRVVLTHNRNDFLTLAAQRHAEGRPHAGMLIAVRGNPYRIAKRLRRWLDEPPEGSMDYFSSYLPDYPDLD